jgi:hypothetical protein
MDHVLRCGCNRYWHSFRDHARHGGMCNKMYDPHCFFGGHTGSNKCDGINRFPFLYNRTATSSTPDVLHTRHVASGDCDEKLPELQPPYEANSAPTYS